VCFRSDAKRTFWRQSHTLHPHADQVRDPRFTSGAPVFDPRDLVPVKDELGRRVRGEGASVCQATALFARSRPPFYAAQAAWERAGSSGWLPVPPGPRQAHPLTDELITELPPLAQTMASAELAVWVPQPRNLSVHPRSLERARTRAAQQGGPSSGSP